MIQTNCQSHPCQHNISGTGNTRLSNSNILNNHCNLDFEHGIPIFSRDNLANDEVVSSECSEDIVETQKNYYTSLHCYFDLENRIAIFLYNPLDHDMPHHTKFGYKRFSSSEDSIQTSKWNLESLLTLQFNYFPGHLFVMIYHQTKFGCKRIGGSEKSRNSHIWLYKTSLWSRR